jgi:hypothetical protein
MASKKCSYRKLQMEADAGNQSMSIKMVNMLNQNEVESNETNNPENISIISFFLNAIFSPFRLNIRLLKPLKDSQIF